MAKILLISGHGAGDAGACGNGYREANLTREFVNILAPKLSKYAVVDVYDQNRDAFQDLCKGCLNISNAYTYILEVHFNSASSAAYGSEIYVVHEESGITVEQEIMKHMANFFTLRDNDSMFDGVKRENFGVINRVHSLGMSGALLEVCFISNASDIHTYQSNKYAIADGVVQGVVDGFGLTLSNDQTSPLPTPNNSTHVQAYSIGDIVRFSTCYTSSNAPISEHLNASDMARDTGTITKIIADAKNPYLLDQGLCWVNDGDIREVLNASTPSAESNTGTVTFPQSGGAWNVYPLGAAPIYGNQIGQINPGYYGDLTYVIVDQPQTNVVTIDTETFGRVNVYASLDDGVKFS
ncbi:MAG: N-acetylmuramoyl-L-alanine amidase [Beduini sp.]|uniref:N-acetylmuramoyl-L-alanine amidase n=1 Tax=Beduini sp. TaxID=1922300 RepID=UPI0039A0E683